ncbi:MAG TPA: S41 family peptidase [Opitutaceae bacterium]|nr:S41 family peptidase [Opitutaceae bacterium]
MFKRILILLGAALVGFAACLAAIRVSGSWSLFPNRDLNRSSDYVKEVLKIVNENYVDPSASGYDALARLSIHGMVDGLDPHSEYLESKDNEELEEDLDGEFGGIGIEVEAHKGAFAVIEPIPGSPGEKAGILSGDVLVSIEGKALERGLPMETVVTRLRGKPGTHVRVGLLRPATGARLSLDLVREVIKIESVRGARVIDGTTGYLQVTEFSDHTGEQFVAALNTLLKAGIDGLVIDLRNNPGGLIDAAVDVAEPFFKKGELVVYTQGRRPEDRDDYVSEADGAPLAIPVAVLINADTASAAEIVTGALKDTRRAVVVGERSFGKGSVQSIFTLKSGEGLRLTTAHYFTPSGALIHGVGITPQVEVIMSPDEDWKLGQQLARPDITDPAQFAERFGFAPIEDRQLEAALDVLRVARLFKK